MLRWFRRRFRKVPAQWTDPRKEVRYENPYGTADVIVAVWDKDYRDVMVPIRVYRDHVILLVRPDYDETNLIVKVYG